MPRTWRAAIWTTAATCSPKCEPVFCAMTAGMYMAALGGTGIRELARLNYDKAEYFKAGLVKAGAKICFASPTFNEFVVEFAGNFKPSARQLLKKKIVAGLELGGYYPNLKGKYLFCVTETVSREIIDAVVGEVKKRKPF